MDVFDKNGKCEKTRKTRKRQNTKNAQKPSDFSCEARLVPFIKIAFLPWFWYWRVSGANLAGRIWVDLTNTTLWGHDFGVLVIFACVLRHILCIWRHCRAYTQRVQRIKQYMPILALKLRQNGLGASCAGETPTWTKNEFINRGFLECAVFGVFMSFERVGCKVPKYPKNTTAGFYVKWKKRKNPISSKRGVSRGGSFGDI